jgi:antitoxin component YwqK of YwqJK toxin-antitoxin module
MNTWFKGLFWSLSGLATATLAFCFSPFLVDRSTASFVPVAYEYHYKGRPFTGVAYSLFPSYRPQQIIFVWQGKRVGTEFIWYDNGSLMASRPYKNGLPHGPWKQWYEDGKVKSLKNYVEGVVDGESWAWHANGQIAEFNLHDREQEITHKSWVADGVPFYNYVYQDGEKVGMKGGEFCKRLEVLKK